MALFRVVQEGLTNVRRHSGSEIAKIRLERRAETIVIEISDEGIGFGTDSKNGNGNGHSDSSIGMGVGIPGMRQ